MSSNANNTELSAPLAVITADDQRGVLWIVGLLSLVFIYLTISLRAFVRWMRWQADDYALFAACILVLVQCTVAFVAARIGLGASFILSDHSRMVDVWRVSPNSLQTLCARPSLTFSRCSSRVRLSPSRLCSPPRLLSF